MASTILAAAHEWANMVWKMPCQIEKKYPLIDQAIISLLVKPIGVAIGYEGMPS
jgi:hypothetical protein